MRANHEFHDEKLTSEGPQEGKFEEVVEEREPRPLQEGACWCPGIGQEVVTGATFPILLGKC